MVIVISSTYAVILFITYQTSVCVACYFAKLVSWHASQHACRILICHVMYYFILTLVLYSTLFSWLPTNLSIVPKITFWDFSIFERLGTAAERSSVAHWWIFPLLPFYITRRIFSFASHLNILVRPCGWFYNAATLATERSRATQPQRSQRVRRSDTNHITTGLDAIETANTITQQHQQRNDRGRRYWNCEHNNAATPATERPRAKQPQQSQRLQRSDTTHITTGLDAIETVNTIVTGRIFSLASHLNILVRRCDSLTQRHQQRNDRGRRSHNGAATPTTIITGRIFSFPSHLNILVRRCDSLTQQHQQRNFRSDLW